MTIAIYRYSQPNVVIQNGTANTYTARLEYKDNTTANITSLPGTALLFKNVDAVVMDDADYGNISIAEYDNNMLGFFLK